MERRDWIGLGISLAAHVVLLAGFAFVTMAAVDEQPIGYVEVELGPLAQGMEVEEDDPAPEADEVVEETPPQAEPQPEAAPPRPQPVNLPDQAQPVVDPETVDDPDEAEPAEKTGSRAEAETIAPEKPPTPKPLGGGTGGQGTQTGQQGTGSDPQRLSPFQIEGLNRTPISAPPPAYTANVNAVIRVRITVDPAGRIVGRMPLIKADPALEKAVMDVLLRWRFNALPANAPQERQTGTITFRFRRD